MLGWPTHGSDILRPQISIDVPETKSKWSRDAPTDQKCQPGGQPGVSSRKLVKLSHDVSSNGQLTLQLLDHLVGLKNEIFSLIALDIQAQDHATTLHKGAHVPRGVVIKATPDL
jgi:hypothetical protein